MIFFTIGCPPRILALCYKKWDYLWAVQKVLQSCPNNPDIFCRGFSNKCPVLYFACLKQKYKKQLAEVLWNKQDDRRFVNEGEGAQLLMQEYEKMDQKVVDLSFKKTGLPIYDVTCEEANLSEEEIFMQK